MIHFPRFKRPTEVSESKGNRVKTLPVYRQVELLIQELTETPHWVTRETRFHDDYSVGWFVGRYGQLSPDEATTLFNTLSNPIKEWVLGQPSSNRRPFVRLSTTSYAGDNSITIALSSDDSNFRELQVSGASVRGASGYLDTNILLPRDYYGQGHTRPIIPSPYEERNRRMLMEIVKERGTFIFARNLIGAIRDITTTHQ